MHGPSRPAIAALALVALLGSACSSSSGSDTTRGATATQGPTASPMGGTGNSGATVTIKDFAYQINGPVRSGEQVAVVNNDSFAHTMTLGGTNLDLTVPAMASSVLVAPTAPGRYPITCNFHPNMQGQLDVS